MCEIVATEAANVHDLAVASPKDAVWDQHKAASAALAALYSRAQDFEKLARRISRCAGRLDFALVPDDDGVLAFKLHRAEFCRVRHCTVCQWRRSLMWLARFYQALPRIEAEHPKARWLLLTLTVRNCPVDQLRATIKDMNRAWHALIKRPEFRIVRGWIRTTEVTRGRDGSAHPHFHVLLMVPPSYFSRHYVTQKRWAELWREVAKLDYDPVVDIRPVKPHLGVASAAPEVLKYATKPLDMLADPEWLYELTRQVHRLRFIATGGVLKDVLREDQESDADLVHVEGSEASEESIGVMSFAWQQQARKYRRTQAG
jgi:plasmid rolling circle replication initiator protein Rep